MTNDSDYTIRLKTLEAMGGDVTKKYDSVYEIDIEILRLTEQGGGGGGAQIDDTSISTTSVWSSSKVSTELGSKANSSDLANYATNASLAEKADTSYVNTNFPKLVSLTQQEYDGLQVKDPSTLYYITDASNA